MMHTTKVLVFISALAFASVVMNIPPMDYPFSQMGIITPISVPR